MRVAVACVAIWLGLLSAALACDYSPPQPFEIEADPSDQQAPPPPRATLERVKRGQAPQRNGCGWQATSCDDSGFVLIDLGLEDADSDEIGYVFEVRGRYPSALDALANRPLDQSWEGNLQLVWADGEGHTSYDFDIYLWTVDRAGNMSESPTKLHVEDQGADGCAALASSARGGPLLPLLLALFLWRRQACLRGH
jgi:hypothetical protein